MIAIFDAIEDDFDKFIAAAEEVFPDFKKKMESKLREKDDAELLQEEQNLFEKIENLRALRQEQTAKLNDCLKELDSIKDKIIRLEAQRTEIHKKWIALHPANTIVKPMKSQAIIPDKIVDDPSLSKKIEVARPDLRHAFECIWNYVGNSCGDNYDLFFKRFDNLCHARCKCTTILGYDWMIGDVMDVLQAAGEKTLALQLADFYTYCENKKK